RMLAREAMEVRMNGPITISAIATINPGKRYLEVAGAAATGIYGPGWARNGRDAASQMRPRPINRPMIRGGCEAVVKPAVPGTTDGRSARRRTAPAVRIDGRISLKTWRPAPRPRAERRTNELVERRAGKRSRSRGDPRVAGVDQGRHRCRRAGTRAPPAREHGGADPARRGTPAVRAHHRVHQHHPAAPGAEDARRLGDGVEDPLADPLERDGDGGAGQPQAR